MKHKETKTNAMRFLDKNNLLYEALSYDTSLGIDGKSVAKTLDISENVLFKTLVTQGKSGSFYVFVIPVSSNLNFKKAAKATSEKSISMIAQKDLFSLTGYIHGGCSPLGMKKVLPTFFHDTAKDFEYVYFNAGKIGLQIKCNVLDLSKIFKLSFFNLID